MRLKYLLTFVICIIGLQVTYAQLSTKHYIPPITTATNAGDNIGIQYLYISTPKTQNIPFTITPVGGTPVNGLVSNGTPFVYRIADPALDGTPNGNNSQFHQNAELTSQINTDKGFIIESEDVVYVSVRVRQAGNQFHAGALVSKGLTALGDTFRTGGFITENAPIGGHQNFVSVMATENNTAVTFTVPTGIVIANYSGPTPVVINLNEGETYVLTVGVSAGGNPNDLVGSLVSSDKPIVVNTGSSTSTFGPGAGRDYGIDQIVDASKVGSEYIFVRGNGSDPWENVLIVAHQDNTAIFVNGNPVAIATINAGQNTVIEGGSYNTNGNMYVQTSNPTFAYQGIGGLNGGGGPAEPNQGMFFVPPLSCENRGNVDNIADINGIGTDTSFTGGVTIVTNSGATVLVNGQNIGAIVTPGVTVTGPFAVTGNTNYETYRITGLTGDVSVNSTGELYCAYFNYSGAAASGSFYSGFPSPPEINFNTNIATLGNCIPNVTLQSLNTALFDSFEWFYDDGTGFVTTGNTSSSITPTQAGSYKLVGTIVCSGATFESQVIPVSLCPDDLDGDLIIDNLDLDLDDDGILNCDESRGNVIIDYTNTNQPVLNFADTTTDATFISSTLNQTGGTSTISGDATGNITTSLDASLNSELEYIMAFSSPSNIDFRQNPAITHTIIDGESFTLIVGPSSKNITLVDPDDILLIDTDFDGIYETGVTSFSSSEVRFRLNPTPTGTTPFRLVANNVDQVTFKHSLNNLTDNSSFSGNLSLTCFTIDNDNDRIPDSLDADSDNDGIPDLIEAQGTNFTLSGIDADMDGFDDVFNGIGVIPIDSDGDGVMDYLDI
ncbi:MAG: IgGFc-binding protein, partial [Flavobacteriaceae bacterium]|nr:IgGFc-binding protein [Flavobacteriaceae bacterium]